nr:amiloride-sensitive sodium channel subunit alpha [Crassostrea gigas]
MYKSVKEVIHSVISQSSVHGLPRILSSKHRYQRVLWLCLVLGTFGFLVHQLYQLFCEYKSYPIKTKVSMKRETLRFPAVSFCNMNAVKKSQMKLINESKLYEHIKDIPDESDSNEYFNDDEMFDPMRNQMNNENNNAEINNTDFYYYHDYFNFFNFWYLNDYDTNLFDDDELNDQPSLNQFITYEKAQQEMKNDPRSEKVKVFKNLFQNMSKSTRKELGHRIEDLLIECSFNGKQCSAENFTLFQSLDFGNCYTLESNLFIARRPGPMNGLQMILQVEKFEQEENFLDGSGVRLVIHEPGTLPFPEEEGFTLSPGYETSIGMKMVALSRSKPPYGNCSEGESFYQTYGVHYTMSTCLHICRNINVIEICKCRPSENIVDIDYMDQFYSLPVCSLVENNKTKKHNFKRTCEEYVYYQIEENKINCGCESACRETVYKNTLSGRVWPKDSYYRQELLNLTCSKRNHTYCSKYDSDINLKDNFLKTVIYYEDLNFEEISEEPLYDGFRFLSDIGGTLGLFLGASILSFVELVQLMVEILYYFRYKCLKNKPAVKKNRIQVEPV